MSITPLLGIADPFSSASHLLGALLGAVMARPLVRRAAHTSMLQVCLGVFALSAVALLLASGVFHWLPRGTPGRDLVQRFDHAGIFLLIAGTFTAGHGLFFKGFWRWGMIALIWTVGVAGVIVKVLFFEAISEGVGLLLYLVMGWFGAAAMIKLAFDRSWLRAGGLLAGGVVYTAGAVGEFLGGDGLVLVPGIVGPHEVFHLAVLGGLAIHWLLFHGVAGVQESSALGFSATPVAVLTRAVPSDQLSRVTGPGCNVNSYGGGVRDSYGDGRRRQPCPGRSRRR